MWLLFGSRKQHVRKKHCLAGYRQSSALPMSYPKTRRDLWTTSRRRTPSSRRKKELYYTAILHEHLDRAVDTVPYWKEEAAYQRQALTQWVPSLDDSADSLRYSIDQLGYWREESEHLTAISDELAQGSEEDF